MRRFVGPSVLLFALISVALAQGAANDPATEDAQDDWTLLFDGKTTSGWFIEGDCEIVDGNLVLGGPRPSSASFEFKTIGTFQLYFEYQVEGMPDGTIRPMVWLSPSGSDLPNTSGKWRARRLIGSNTMKGNRAVVIEEVVGNQWLVLGTGEGTGWDAYHRLKFTVPAGTKVVMRNVKGQGILTAHFLWWLAAGGAGLLAAVASLLFWWWRRVRVWRPAHVSPG